MDNFKIIVVRLFVCLRVVIIHTNLNMYFDYEAFGIPIFSQIELPDLLPLSVKPHFGDPIFVSIGKVKDVLNLPHLNIDPFTILNETELRFEISGLFIMYITDGKTILIEPLVHDISQCLVYIYAVGFAAALLQRNLFPLHVSGVFNNDGKVLLFAAPSQVGKSTTAVKLLERGFELFTDDTALLSVNNGICYATASYPMIRLWQSTLDNQSIYSSKGKKSLSYEEDKFGFNFQEQYCSNKVEVQAIVFLNKHGKKVKISDLSIQDCFENLIYNVYRSEWINGMKKQQLQFLHLSEISNSVKAYSAFRPKNRPSFDAFANEIENILLKPTLV